MGKPAMSSEVSTPSSTRRVAFTSTSHVIAPAWTRAERVRDAGADRHGPDGLRGRHFADAEEDGAVVGFGHFRSLRDRGRSGPRRRAPAQRSARATPGGIARACQRGRLARIAPSARRAWIAPSVHRARIAPSARRARIAPSVHRARIAPSVHRAWIAPSVHRARIAPSAIQAWMAPSPQAIAASRTASE
jgi:hypothetical protein